MPNQPQPENQQKRSGVNVWLIALIVAAAIGAYFFFRGNASGVVPVASGQRWKDWTPQR